VLIADSTPAGRVSPPIRTSRNLHVRKHKCCFELRDELGGLPSPAHAEHIWRGIWLEEAHNSTAIEGNTLVLKQVEQLLSDGRAVGNKELSEYLEVQDYGGAANWVYSQAIEPGDWIDGDLISLAEVRHVHNLAMTLVWDVAPHPQATDRDAQALRNADQASIIEDIATLHGRFEQIHPYLDGNGRAGRLVLNLLLIRLGYPPAIVYKADRPRYLAALRHCDQGDPSPLGELLARAVLDNLYRFVIPALAGPDRLVPLPALATPTLSANALRVAATRGRLKATKGPDGAWRSSKAWVNEYVHSRHTRS
jgi:hypothetical protein